MLHGGLSIQPDAFKSILGMLRLNSESFAFVSLRTQQAGCFDADLCARRNEGRDEEQTACDGGSPSPRLPSDTGVDSGERMSAVTTLQQPKRSSKSETCSRFIQLNGILDILDFLPEGEDDSQTTGSRTNTVPLSNSEFLPLALVCLQ
ncbi:hypothetical protein D4764_12G0003620 [Takifugu flavidus]|uniref:Uncharacterized protein n=1 Tax=Takifugu flavidus TaxID=433684 RepID=A0A5C6PB32_9TELE|nr:hypothetical protein D4764_12G0003620 [Takifugu flavidus]